MTAVELYALKNEMITEYGGELTTSYNFYRDIFPIGSFERKEHYEDKRPNGIFIVIKENGVIRHQLTDELLELSEISKSDFAVMSPVGYYGKERNGRNASELYAFTVDLDAVGVDELRNLLYQFSTKYTLTPTYLVNSGNGLHLYYVLDEPLPLYPQLQRKLKDIKYALIRYTWTSYTSQIEPPQMQGILQGFRMVGTATKLGADYPVIAYKIGDKVSLEQIMRVLPEDVYIAEREYISKLPLKKAKELYPDWYERRVEKGEARGRWHIKRDLYDWWKKQIVHYARYGHRYFCIMCLAIYAQKCDISEDELRADALSFVSILDNNPEHPFTEDDVINALEVYQESYCTFPRKDIEKISGVTIPPNKRNGRKRAEHIKLMNFVRDEINQNNNWRDGNGRKSKSELVTKWRSEHPSGTKSECRSDLGLDPKTIRKWWNDEE